MNFPELIPFARPLQTGGSGHSGDLHLQLLWEEKFFLGKWSYKPRKLRINMFIYTEQWEHNNMKYNQGGCI